MPQLRDSSNSLPAGDSRESAVVSDNSFERIFGIETEYGVSVTHAHRASDDRQALDASHVANVMFEPVVSRYRSTNTYCDNGSRVYLDVGAHPEYATAEARTVREAVLLDAAGESYMASLASYAQKNLVSRENNETLRVHVYKNNTDSQGHSFGCHENYLVRRSVSITALQDCFIPFLATRQIFAGAGVIREGQFQIAQRSDFLDDTISSATTRSRPMINTRDEPHADSRVYRRLHVIVGDSNRSQTASWMKMMTAHLVLCMIEAQSRGEDYGLARMSMDNVSDHMKAISRDLDFTYTIAVHSGESYTALDIQRSYCAAARDFVRQHAQDLEPDVLTDAQACLTLWEECLDNLENHDFTALSSWVDWAAKYQLISRLQSRGAEASKLRQLDFAYHDIAHDAVVQNLESRGLLRRLFSTAKVRAAMSQPPRGTRAELRSAFVRAAQASRAHWAADWTSISVYPSGETQAVSAQLLDPFGTQETADYQCVMRTISGNGRDNPLLPLV
ncbi:proteasome accessory factor PafA2 family protein [Alloscardovia criceti]|uniref:proteasome accessory factor PafA2 family protein n=1 Tax=Alloscardovia criceti TaxID=356828 RepID=UPI00037D2BF2|nr:proteasome accessory factor PafA2 family protein [Alloscardovia criceti]